MSIDMILGSARNQTNSIKSLTTKQIASYEEIERALTNFVTQTHNLKGVTYDSAKAYCSSVLTPVIRGSILLDQAIARSNEQYINTYTGEVHNDSLKQSDLERAIEETKSQIAFNERLLNEHFEQDTVDLREVSNLQDKISSYRKIQHDLEEKLRKLLAFNAKSPSFFQEITALQNAVDQGMAIANKSWSPTSKSFSIPSREDMGWTDIIEGKWEEKDYSRDDLNYKESLKVQYGFDDKAARIIVKLKRNIYKDSRIKDDEKDYVLTRLLGGLSYDLNPNLKGWFEKSMWQGTAGIGKNFGDNLMDIETQLKAYLNLTNEEYEYLKYKVRIQHSGIETKSEMLAMDIKQYNRYKDNMEKGLGTKLTNEEFNKLWDNQVDSFRDKTDFAHQYITIATHLYGKPRVPDFLGGHNNTNDMSGWYGDVTDAAFAKPSMGNDDYKADLDSVNITSIMKKDNISLIEASNKYYKNLENGTYNRAIEFKKNKGDDTTKNKIYSYYIVKSRYDKQGWNLNKEEFIKKKSSHAYNFVKSLENNKNELQDYYSKE